MMVQQMALWQLSRNMHPWINDSELLTNQIQVTDILMNKGIDAARGQYLGILEPDDFVPSSMFRALYRIASRNNLDFVKADFYRFTVI